MRINMSPAISLANRTNNNAENFKMQTNKNVNYSTSFKSTTMTNEAIYKLTGLLKASNHPEWESITRDVLSEVIGQRGESSVLSDGLVNRIKAAVKSTSKSSETSEIFG